jgi:hypothetical protein
MKIAGVVSGGKNSSIHRFKMRFGEKERNCVMEKRGIEARRGVYISLKPQKNTCTASHTLSKQQLSLPIPQRKQQSQHEMKC